MGERVINIRDLICDILLHWRGIILWMLVGGIVAGAVSYARMAQSAVEQRERREWLEELDAAELQEEMTQKELAEVELLLLNELSFEKWCSYVEHSALMGLDASRLYQEDLIYAVAAVGGGQSVAAGTYVNLLDSNEMRQFVAGRVEGFEASDLQELTKITLLGSVNQEYTSFSMTIVAGTKEDCAGITEAVKAYIEDVHESMAEAFGTHGIICLRDEVTVADSQSLLQRQIEIHRKLISLQEEAERLGAALSERQRRYYQLRTCEVNEESDKGGMEGAWEEVGLSGLSGCIRDVGWGMFFAAFLYGMAIFFRFLLDGRLRYTDDCTVLFHVPELGHIPARRAVRTPFQRLDRGIYRLRDKGRYVAQTQEAIGLTVATIKIMCRREGIHRVCKVGCSMSPGVMEEMEKKLAVDDIVFQDIGNILYDADSMGALGVVGTAVLMERAGAVSCREIQRELEVLRLQGAGILGIVIVE